MRGSGRVGGIAAGRFRLSGGLQFGLGGGAGVGFGLQPFAFGLLDGLLASLQFFELKLRA